MATQSHTTAAASAFQLNLDSHLSSSDDLPSGNMQRLSLSNISSQHTSAQASPDFVVLKIRNIPSDLTIREAILIFSLCIDDIHTVDIRHEPSNTNPLPVPVIYARFISPKTASQVLQLLNNKQLFGINYPNINCELTHEFSRNNSLAELANGSDLLTKFSQPTTRNSVSFAQAAAAQQQQPPQQQQQQSQQPPQQHQAQQQQQPSIPPASATQSMFNFDNPLSNSPPSPPPNVSTLVGNIDPIVRGFSSSQRFDQFQNGTWANNRPDNLNLSNTSQPGSSNLTTPMGDWSQSHFFPSTQSPMMLQQAAQQQQQSSPQSQAQSNVVQQQPANSPQQQQQLATNQIDSKTSKQPSTPVAQIDLSLLARVPPPANPADQNPPCNTLYVGNLPPDATEMELRSLFQSQPGFRRLSFRTKQNSSGVSHHGPMCFVEFEDVAHATKALAEMYGRQLVRTNGNPVSNKGGIRLSFSKNPLGVRGPPRKQQQQVGGSKPQSLPSTPNKVSNGYGYFNGYQQQQQQHQQLQTQHGP